MQISLDPESPSGALRLLALTHSVGHDGALTPLRERCTALIRDAAMEGKLSGQRNHPASVGGEIYFGGTASEWAGRS